MKKICKSGKVNLSAFMFVLRRKCRKGIFAAQCRAPAHRRTRSLKSQKREQNPPRAKFCPRRLSCNRKKRGRKKLRKRCARAHALRMSAGAYFVRFTKNCRKFTDSAWECRPRIAIRRPNRRWRCRARSRSMRRFADRPRTRSFGYGNRGIHRQTRFVTLQTG